MRGRVGRRKCQTSAGSKSSAVENEGRECAFSALPQRSGARKKSYLFRRQNRRGSDAGLRRIGHQFYREFKRADTRGISILIVRVHHLVDKGGARPLRHVLARLGRRPAAEQVHRAARLVGGAVARGEATPRPHRRRAEARQRAGRARGTDGRQPRLRPQLRGGPSRRQRGPAAARCRRA